MTSTSHIISPSPTLESSPLDSHISDDVAGMIAIVSFSTLSNIACVSTFAWIYFHRYDYKGTTITPLVLNLLMADFLQSIGFMLSSHWIVIGRIVPGALCSFQGIIINIGDVASGFWALAICVQTFIYVVANLDYSKFAIISMIIIWPCNIFLATAGLFISTPSEPFYNSAGGAWCWISTKYSIYRITFHYGIILCVAALMFVLYAIIYASLFWRRRVLSQTIGRQNAPLGLKNVANKLVWYPIVYIVLIFPLALQRFATLDGAEWPFGYLISAACIFSSAGFVNSVIYGVTRNFISLQPITSRFQRAFRKTLGTRCISESMMSDGEDSFTAESLYQRTDNGLSIKVEEMDERGKGKQRETMANRDIENDDIVEDDSSTYDQYSRGKKEPGKEVKVHNNINNECDNDGVSIEQSNNRSRIIPSIIQNSASSWKFLEQFVVNFGKRNSSTLNVEV